MSCAKVKKARTRRTCGQDPFNSQLLRTPSSTFQPSPVPISRPGPVQLSPIGTLQFPAPTPHQSAFTSRFFNLHLPASSFHFSGPFNSHILCPSRSHLPAPPSHSASHDPTAQPWPLQRSICRPLLVQLSPLGSIKLSTPNPTNSHLYGIKSYGPSTRQLDSPTLTHTYTSETRSLCSMTLCVT